MDSTELLRGRERAEVVSILEAVHTHTRKEGIPCRMDCFLVKQDLGDGSLEQGDRWCLDRDLLNRG